MGEEAKKPEETKPEETKEEEVAPKPEAAGEEKKPEEEAKEAPPPPPQEIVLKVFMHCEGCARKVKRCLKGFDGVEDVKTDCRTSKVVVKGEKADPLKVLERVQRKSHRQVELISPIPKPPPAGEETKKTDEKEAAPPKADDKKDELPEITVVLRVYMHCEACGQEIKKRILKMKGVESAEPDLKASQVTVKGKFEPEKLTEHVLKRTGKHATIINVEPEKKPEEVDKGKEEKKEEDKKDEKDQKAGEEKKDGGEEKKEGGGGDAAAPAPDSAAEPPAKEEAEPPAEDLKMEMKKNEFYYYYPQNHQQVYPQRFVQENYHAYPPQIFSDENPNACSVM